MNLYTTKRGKQLPLTPKLWNGIKRCAQKQFDGSIELFESCWRKYVREILPATDNPSELSDVTGWLDQIASELVNDPESDFYIYG